ncbi:MFS transporter [Baekduia alba]|uniref:MFS transporter n=1 Tax=Baekduia alba TaxID=2997333 RepID=UPI002341441B|nr:MFS transporter [Baekduia alba]
MTSIDRRYAALAVVLLAQLMVILDTTVVNVALGDIGRDLHFSPADLTWVINAYLIAYGSFLLVAGRLGDLFGRRRVFLAGVLLFTAASAACAAADGQVVLVAARFLQGVGGALASAAILALITVEFPDPDERARAMSAYIFVSVGGGSLGLLAGGALIDAASWHWIFLINLPIGIATVGLGARVVAETGQRGEGTMDLLGAALVTVATMLGVYAIVKAPDHGWLSGSTLGLAAASIALLVAFAVWERRIEHPILPGRVLAIGSLMRASAVRAALGVGLYASFFLGALYFERARGLGPLTTGVAFLPQTLTVAALSLGTTAKVVARFGPRATLLAGMAATFGGLVLLALASADVAYAPLVLAAMVLIGLGAGLSFVPILTMALADVPPADAGVASGIVNVTMYIASATGLAVVGAVADERTGALRRSGHSAADALLGGYHLGFALAAGGVAVAAGVAALVLRPAREPAAARAEA